MKLIVFLLMFLASSGFIYLFYSKGETDIIRVPAKQAETSNSSFQ